MVDGKIVIPDGEIRVELDSFPGFGERLFILTRVLVNDPRQYLVGLRLTGIGSRPRLTGLSRLFQAAYRSRQR